MASSDAVLRKDVQHQSVAGAVTNDAFNYIQPLLVDPTTGYLLVQSSGSTGGTSAVDGSTFTIGTTSETPAGGVYQASYVALATGKTGAFGMTAYRAILSAQVDSLGNDATDTTNHAVRVNVVAGSSGNAAASATGSAVPASASYDGINVAGTLRGQTGVNPSGVVYAAQQDITSINGATVLVGNGTSAGALRVSLSSDSTGQVVLAAGAAVIGAVTQSGTWNVGTVTTVSTVTAVTAITNALPAGTNLMGKVGIDQTTVGTTNGVSIAQIGANTVLTGNGASGTGAQRVNISNDNTGIANWGQGATGSAVPSGAQYKGLLAKTANPTAASDGNLTGAMADKLGRQVVVIGNVRDNKANQFTTITSSTAETTVVTAVASTFLDVYGCIVENTSATATKVTFKDSTAGTTQFEIYVPAGDTRGFMLPSSDAFKQTTVNTSWTATCGTSVASVVISMLYVKNI